MSSDTQTFDIRMDSLLNVFSGLQNPYTGMGNPYVDPTQHTYIQPGLSRLSRQEQSALVRQSGLLKKLTTNLPKAATWRWGRPTLANGDAKLLQAIADAVNNIQVVTPLQRLGKTKKGYQVAGELALQTGNSGFILDVDDGRKLDEPLDRKNIKRINKLALLSRHALRPDLSTLSNGLSEHYIVMNAYNMKDYVNGQRIHRSRVHWFRGVPILDDYDLIANNGCDDSILELVRDAWFLYQPAINAMGRMLTDFDVPVRKVKDLAQNLADRGDEYKAELLARLQIDQISRSNYRTQVIDMDNESLDNWTRQIAGMADLSDRMKQNLLGSINEPAAVMFGEFASGLNSTGQSTTEKQLWNETTVQFQIDKYDDNVQDLQQIVCLCKTGPTGGNLPDGLGWEWLAPYPPLAEEQADLELKRAQLIQDLNGVDPRFGKVAIASTYGQKEYNSNITLPKPYADALQRDIKEEAKPQPTEPDVSALQGGNDDQPDEAQSPEDDQAQQDQSIADDVLSDRTLLDSADVHLDASRSELLAKAKAKNEGLPKGKKFVVFGKTNAAIAEFVGEGVGQPATTAKTTAKPKGGTQGGKYQTKQTSSAIATAIAKKTGAEPEAIEKDLRGKIQKAIDKTRREAKKAGKEPTDKELRAAARAVVKVEAKRAIASASGEGKPATAPPVKTEKMPAKQAKATGEKAEKQAKPSEPITEKPAVIPKLKAEKKPKETSSSSSKANAIKAADDFLSHTPYALAKRQGFGGLHQRVTDANQEIKSGAFGKKTTEEQANFLSSQVNNGAHNAINDNGVSGVSGVQQQHLYNSLTDAQKDALAVHIKDHPYAGDWVIATAKNPRIKAISEDVEQRIQKLKTAKKQAPKKAENDDLDDLFGDAPKKKKAKNNETDDLFNGLDEDENEPLKQASKPLAAKIPKGFPSAQKFTEAKLAQFQAGSKPSANQSDLATTTIDGNDFFVKKVSAKTAAKEQAVSAISALLGADAVHQSHVYKKGENLYALSPILKGKSLEAASYQTELKKLSEGELAEHALLDYVIGNDDRHYGNVFLTNDKKLKLIDHDSTFSGNTIISRQNVFLQTLNGTEDGDISDATKSKKLPKNAVQHILRHEDKLKEAVKAAGLDTKAFDRRLEVLKQDKSPTIGTIVSGYVKPAKESITKPLTVAKSPKSKKIQLNIEGQKVDIVSGRSSLKDLTFVAELAGGSVDYGSSDKQKEIGVHSIDFKVNGGFDIGTVDSAKAGAKIAIGIKNSIREHLKSLPNNQIVHCQPYAEDGFGDRRASLYKKSGFGDPDSDNHMWGMVKDGKVEPIAPSDLKNIVERVK